MQKIWEKFLWNICRIDQSYSCKNKNCAKNNCPKNSIKQYFMLINFWDFKKSKNQNKYKKIINRKCLFYPICRLKSCKIFWSMQIPYKPRKRHRKRNPKKRITKCLFIRNFVRFFIKNAKIDNQHYNNENNKADYQPRGITKNFSIHTKILRK